MAYFLKNQNDEQNQQSGNQNQMSGGNIYSTSGSEVSSSTSNNSTNSSSNSSASNESGNWVNLNKYLDANQGKVGGYVDQLVNPYTNSSNQFKNDLNKSSQDYTEKVNQNTLSKDDATSIINKYRIDGNSITDDEYNKVSKPLNDNFGVTSYEETEDYTNLNKQANQLGNVGKNLSNSAYQQSLMGNDISSGGKKLNSFLINATNQGRRAIEDKQNAFKNLSALLDSQAQDLTNQRNTALENSSANAREAYNEAVNDGGQVIYDAFNEQLKNLLNSYNYYPTSVNSNATYSRYVPSTNGSLTLDNGTVLNLPSISRAEKNKDAMNQGYSDNSRLESLLSGSGRLDNKLGSMFAYTDDDWTGIENRANTIEGIIQNPKNQFESRISDILRNYLRSGYRKDSINNAYNAYLRGDYNNYDDPLAHLYSELIKANRTYGGM